MISLFKLMKWVCTKCTWSGPYDEMIHVTYHGVDWEHCPSCNNIAIPACGTGEYSERESKNRELFIVPLWISKFTCSKCGRKEDFAHHGMKTKIAVIKDVPSLEWNGWRMGKKPLCPTCLYNQSQHEKRI